MDAFLLVFTTLGEYYNTIKHVRYFLRQFYSYFCGLHLLFLYVLWLSYSREPRVCSESLLIAFGFLSVSFSQLQ